MNIFLNTRCYLSAILITLITLFLLGFFFSTLYYLLPLRIPILPIFANISLGLAVFCGAFHLSVKTPFFRMRNIIIHSTAVIFFLFIIGAIFGDANEILSVEKYLFPIIASFLGEFCGNL